MTAAEYDTYFSSRYKFTSSFFAGAALMLVDAALLLLCIGAGFFIINSINHGWINFRSFVTYSAYLPPILMVFFAADLYPGILLAPQDEVKRFSICTFFALMGIALSISVETDDRWPIAAALGLAWPLATVALPTGREAARRAFSFFGFKWWGVPAVIYSKDGNGLPVVDRLVKRRYYGYSPALIITDMPRHPEEYRGIPVFSPGEDISAAIKRTRIKVAIICDYDQDLERIQTYYRYMIRVPKNQLATTMSLHMKDLGGILGFSSTNYLTVRRALIFKRATDIILCLLAAPFVLLASAAIIIAIKADSPGPILYGHQRVGRNRRKIRCWKFRSMCVDADEQLRRILATDPARAAEWEKDRKFTDDPRVTRVGKFLRKTSLDELPQLWNIFTGEMSFVGPRPVTEPELDKYGTYADYVLSVQPGLSGMWQISGRSDTGYEERITLDTYYIQNWSVWLDFWIILRTFWVVFKGKGAY